MSAEHEAAILADLRRTHAQLKVDRENANVNAWSMRLTIEEVDLLLAIVDERDELRRQTVGDLETPFAPVRVGRITFPTLTDEEKVTINTCPHAGTHHSCPLGGCPSFERREVVGNTPHDDPDWYDTHCPTCDAPEPGHTPECAVVHVGREARETPPMIDVSTGTPRCVSCGLRIRHYEDVREDGTEGWLHDQPFPAYVAPHLASPILAPNA